MAFGKVGAEAEEYTSPHLLSFDTYLPNSSQVSGLSMPVGLRAPSAPDGSAEEPSAALTALQAAALPRPFLGVTSHGTAGIVESTGNPVCSIVLSGGVGGVGERTSRVLSECEKISAPVIAECAGPGVGPVEQVLQKEGVEIGRKEVVGGEEGERERRGGGCRKGEEGACDEEGGGEEDAGRGRRRRGERMR